MLKKFLFCIVVSSMCSATGFAQDFFISFDDESVVTSTTLDVGTSSSAFIFSSETFQFDNARISFSSADLSVAAITGGQGIGGVVDETAVPTEPTSPFLTDGARFDNNTANIIAPQDIPNPLFDPQADPNDPNSEPEFIPGDFRVDGGRFLGIGILGNGVRPQDDQFLGSNFDPDFVSGVGSLLAEITFDVLADGTTTLDFDPLTVNAIVDNPGVDLSGDVTFQSATITGVGGDGGGGNPVVPEPTSAVVLALGFAGLFTRRRR